jgi:hypothetical protein
MAKSSTWTGWIAFAGWLLIIIGMIDFFQGLIAIIRGAYYHVSPDQIVVVDLKTWGWIMLFWGIILILVGFGLLGGSGFARWTVIVLASLNFIAQLGFVGSASSFPLWALTGLALNIVILYALIVRWGDSAPQPM